MAKATKPAAADKPARPAARAKAVGAPKKAGAAPKAAPAPITGPVEGGVMKPKLLLERARADGLLVSPPGAVSAPGPRPRG